MLYIASFLAVLGLTLLFASWASRQIEKGGRGWK